MFHQAQPGRLRGVGGLTLGQLEVPGYCPDRLAVVVNQPVPCLVVPIRRSLHRERGVESVFHGPEATHAERLALLASSAAPEQSLTANATPNLGAGTSNASHRKIRGGVETCGLVADRAVLSRLSALESDR